MHPRTEAFLVETGFGLAILVVLLVVWLVVKACELLARAFAAHATSKPLWFAFGLFLTTGLSVWLTGGQLLGLNALVPVSLAGLLGTAKVVELFHDPLLQRPRTRQSLVQEVLHEPWWNAD